MLKPATLPYPIVDWSPRPGRFCPNMSLASLPPRKLRWWDCAVVKTTAYLSWISLVNFKIAACDRRTDRRTDGRTMAVHSATQHQLSCSAKKNILHLHSEFSENVELSPFTVTWRYRYDRYPISVSGVFSRSILTVLSFVQVKSSAHNVLSTKGRRTWTHDWHYVYKTVCTKARQGSKKQVCRKHDIANEKPWCCWESRSHCVRLQSIESCTTIQLDGDSPGVQQKTTPLKHRPSTETKNTK